MPRFILPAALAAVLIATASAALAFPASSQVERPANGVVQVRGLCGLGWHRGYYGECHPNGAPYFYGPYAGYGPPPALRCWWTNTPYGARRVCAW